MKILCIGDIHCRNFWRKTVYDNIGKVDKIIFLGDYLDPYPEEIKENPELMEVNDFYDSYHALDMLNDIVSLKKNEPNKFILLTGNHTDSYIWSKFRAATRTDYQNWEKYHKFFIENLSFFNFVWIENDVIFSHAGISEGWANRVWEAFELPEDELSSIKEIAETLQDTPLENFTTTYINVISDISEYRGGDMFYGSCEWADIYEHIDMEISTSDKIISKQKEDCFQIFGHTQLKMPLIADKWACLDCRKGFIVDTLTHKIEECGSNNSL